MGYQLGEEGVCEKIEVKKPTAKRQEPKATGEQKDRAKLDAAPAKPQVSGQIMCNQQGCRPIRSGCRLAYTNAPKGQMHVSSRDQYEVCD
jgi:hypothetical protein